MSQTQKELREQAEQLPVEDSEPVVLNDSEVISVAEDVADNASINDFTAPQSGINHGHDTDKHDVRDAYGVRDEFVSEFFADFGIAPNDHAALWLLSYRKEEAIAHDEPVFKDTSDTDPSRWNKIKNHRSNAPIAPETQEQLKPE